MKNQNNASLEFKLLVELSKLNIPGISGSVQWEVSLTCSRVTVDVKHSPVYQ